MSIRLNLNGRAYTLSAHKLRPDLVLTVDGRQRTIASPPPAGALTGVAYVDGAPMRFQRAQDRGRVWVRVNGRTYVITVDDPFAGGEASRGGDDVRAPMPGGVIEVHCAIGDSVQAGDPLLTIESMKLQTTLRAPRDGVIQEISAGVGQTFEKDAALIRLAPVDREA